MSPTLPTANPTPSPSTPPTRYPTLVCPCIFISSNSSTRFNGMYQLLPEIFNDHQRWYNYDNQGDIYWMDNNARLEQYWLISVPEDKGYALHHDTTDKWGHTPPVGTESWDVYTQGNGFIPGGSEVTLSLECTTCRPTPSPTAFPTVLSTPSPTTPAPTVMPTTSPSSMPSVVPTPSPTRLPTTKDPTPQSAEPTFMPSPSPTALP